MASEAGTIDIGAGSRLVPGFPARRLRSVGLEGLGTGYPPGPRTAVDRVSSRLSIGTRITLQGFGTPGHNGLNGIYSIRTTDGGEAIRLLKGPIEPPDYAPDGTQLVFKRLVGGVNPTGSGALFVMNADGTGVTQITLPGYVLDEPASSPDGRWIDFQKPYGDLFVVRPDGSDLHQVPVQLPAGAGAQDPAWLPDGSTIVFTVLGSSRTGIYTVHVDGTDLHEVAVVKDPQKPDLGSRPS